MTELEKLQEELTIRNLKLSITRAETAKEEIEAKIIDFQIQIARSKEHSERQDEVIKEKKAELAKLGIN